MEDAFTRSFMEDPQASSFHSNESQPENHEHMIISEEKVQELPSEFSHNSVLNSESESPSIDLVSHDPSLSQGSENQTQNEDALILEDFSHPETPVQNQKTEGNSTISPSENHTLPSGSVQSNPLDNNRDSSSLGTSNPNEIFVQIPIPPTNSSEPSESLIVKPGPPTSASLVSPPKKTEVDMVTTTSPGGTVTSTPIRYGPLDFDTDPRGKRGGPQMARPGICARCKLEVVCKYWRKGPDGQINHCNACGVKLYRETKGALTQSRKRGSGGNPSESMKVAKTEHPEENNNTIDMEGLPTEYGHIITAASLLNDALRQGNGALLEDKPIARKVTRERKPNTDNNKEPARRKRRASRQQGKMGAEQAARRNKYGRNSSDSEEVRTSSRLRNICDRIENLKNKQRRRRSRAAVLHSIMSDDENDLDASTEEEDEIHRPRVIFYVETMSYHHPDEVDGPPVRHPKIGTAELDDSDEINGHFFPPLSPLTASDGSDMDY